MTIYLPEKIPLFRQAFDNVCDRILKSEQDETFYARLVQLIINIRTHPLLKNYILELEIENSKQKQEFNKAALAALEDSWKRLLKYHKHNLKHRQQLVLIKRIVTAPTDFQSTPLYNRVCFAMFEFRYNSPIFHLLREAPMLFRKAQLEMQIGPIRATLFSSSQKKTITTRKLTQIKLKERDKLKKLETKIIYPNTNKGSLHFRWSIEELLSALYSPKIIEVGQKFTLKGRNSDEKRRNMYILAEIAPTACWERLNFLNRCYTVKETSLAPKHFKGHWKTIREQAWQSALERCEMQTLLFAKMALGQKHSHIDKNNIDIFLAPEHQIHRRDYERHLKSFQNHVHAYLLKIESEQHECAQNQPTSDPHLALPGTQRKAFAIELARGYWKNNPRAKYDEVYGDYLIKCPKRPLAQTSWERYIRDHKIDPRSKDEKKRSKGKKTLQN